MVELFETLLHATALFNYAKTHDFLNTAAVREEMLLISRSI